MESSECMEAPIDENNDSNESFFDHQDGQEKSDATASVGHP